MDRINLTQDTDRWQVLVHAEMNEQVQPTEGNYLTSREPGSFSGRTLSMELVSGQQLYICAHVSYKQ